MVAGKIDIGRGLGIGPFDNWNYQGILRRGFWGCFVYCDHIGVMLGKADFFVEGACDGWKRRVFCAGECFVCRSD